MMDDRNALFSEQTFARAVEFVWREAEMLDRRDYRAWLDPGTRPATTWCRSIPTRPTSPRR